MDDLTKIDSSEIDTVLGQWVKADDPDEVELAGATMAALLERLRGGATITRPVVRRHARTVRPVFGSEHISDMVQVARGLLLAVDVRGSDVWCREPNGSRAVFNIHSGRLIHKARNERGRQAGDGDTLREYLVGYIERNRTLA